MITISINMFGVEKVQAGLMKVEQGVTNLSPMFEKFGEKRHEEQKEHLDRADFPPLSIPYAAQKRLKVGDKPILQLTGNLYRSLTEKGAPGNVYRVAERSAEFGTSVAYGMFHQTGTSRMPARPPMAGPKVEEYETIGNEYIVQVVKDAGFN